MSDVNDSNDNIGGLEKINTLWKQYNNLINTKPSGYATNEEVPFKNYVIKNDIFNEDVPENILINNDTSLNIILPNNEIIEFIITPNDFSENNNYLNINILDNLFDQSNNILVGSKCNFENLGYKHIEFYYKKECYPTIYNTTNQLYTWFIPEPSNGNISNNETNNLLKNTIASLYDPYYNTYKYKLFYKLGTSFITINFASNPDFAYLDNKSGFLYFYGGTRINNNVTLTNIRSQNDSNPSPPYMSYIRYNGNVGFNNLMLRGNITVDTSLSIINNNVYNDISNLNYNVLNTQQIRQYIENLNISGGSGVSGGSEGSGLTLDQILKSNNDASLNNLDISGILSVDIISNKTHLNGISLESIKIKGRDITNVNAINAENYNLGGTNVISGSRQANFRDIEMKNNSNVVTFLAYGETGNIDMCGTLFVNTINEKTNGLGVTIDGILIKDTITAIDSSLTNLQTNIENINNNISNKHTFDNIELLNQNSIVNIVNSNGNKYLFNNSNSYDASKNYGLKIGTYVLKNIPINHPIALLNNGNSNITYNVINNSPIIIKVSGGQFSSPYYTFNDASNNSINIDSFRFMRNRSYQFVANGISSSHPFKIFVNNAYTNVISSSSGNISFTINSNHSLVDGTFYYQCNFHVGMKKNLYFLNNSVSGTTNDGTYDFYYGDVSINVLGDFGNVSVYCFYHGYMGGENLLEYVSNYYTTTTNVMQDLSSLFFNTITPSKNSSNILININADLYCSYALEERISVELWRDLSMLTQSNNLGSIIATGGLTIPFNLTYLDSPNSNSLIKYYLKYQLENNNSLQKMGIINIQNNLNYGSSNIILREI